MKIFFFLVIFAPTVAFSQNLASFSQSGVDYALEAEGKDSFVFAIRSDQGISISEEDILVLENPNRLVVDLKDIASKAAKNIAVKSQFISAIRVGIHPDKTRIVLDIKARQNPSYQLKKVGKKGTMLELSFSGNQKVTEQVEQFDDEKEEEVEEPKKVVKETTTSSTTLRATTTSTTTSSTTETTTTTLAKLTTTTTLAVKEVSTSTLQSTTSSTTTSSTQKLSKDIVNSQISSNLPNTQTAVTEGSKSGIAVSSIYYQVTENTKLPAVAIDAPNLKSYALTKITPELYELTMEDAHLAGNHLSLPQFPPENFRGFSVVVAREEKSKVVLKIFVEDGTRLFPFIANNQLWIKVAE